jgi:nitrogenase molybdenum-cofactor synthesis protein NifE
MTTAGRNRPEAVYFTAAQLAARGKADIPDALISHTRLIYSSPATLAYNSPGAEGFGVKRAGLAVPESVMLIVSPGCCGRNTSALSEMPAYRHRFFYLTMDETDLVTGRHLTKIPQAVCEVVASLSRKPAVVMICITCVDALLGTDMERVCRRAEAAAGVRVRPCYMYALTREGQRPPMVHVRQSLYSLLEPMKRRGTSVNLLGYFTPLADDCELYGLLRQAGVKRIREISRMADFTAFSEMAEANFNLVLNAEALPAAQDLEKRLGMPFIALSRLYQIDKIESQYAALGQALGVTFDFEEDKNRALAARAALGDAHPGLTFAVGEVQNANPFELALTLLRTGFAVSEIFGTVMPEVIPWIEGIAERSPGTRIYSNLEPSMLYYAAPVRPDITVGADAAYYHPGVPNLRWNDEAQPFGFAGLRRFYEGVTAALAKAAAEERSPR